MGLKKFWKESAVTFIIRKILYAAIALVLVIWLVLFSIDKYTRHGEAIPVPDLKGLYVDEAGQLLKTNDLYVEIIDSVYDRSQPLATILEQIPSSGSVVKKNRAIYVTVNKKLVRKVPLPELNDISYRQAEALINSLRLVVSDIIYRPSEYKDLVIDVLKDSISIPAGTKLPEGTRLSLVVGSGLGSEKSTIPNLVGMKMEEGRRKALSSSFVIGAKNTDRVQSNDKVQTIYKQDPPAGSIEAAGTRIDLWLTDEPDDVKNAENSENSDEEFF